MVSEFQGSIVSGVNLIAFLFLRLRVKFASLVVVNSLLYNFFRNGAWFLWLRLMVAI